MKQFFYTIKTMISFLILIVAGVLKTNYDNQYFRKLNQKTDINHLIKDIRLFNLPLNF